MRYSHASGFCVKMLLHAASAAALTAAAAAVVVVDDNDDDDDDSDDDDKGILPNSLVCCTGIERAASVGSIPRGIRVKKFSLSESYP